ncbi:MAG: 30S ribosome-binding factor RbfA [Candidatus Pacebacteria bacterium]|nr:30S ribosome-binding factor RbfA [Candidatus Paceibacterota bacterium]MDD3919507.1 30S ribosome-binding factor RbfA [Candidatus Paceibacterota bacterium]
MYRKEKLDIMIQKELSQALLKELDLPSDIVVTVTRVEVSSNGFSAKVYISVLPSEKNEQILKTLTRKVYFIQQALNKKLKIRPVPRIEFVKEKKTEEASRIELLLKQIKDLEKK